jgi:hypothetical protein
MENFALTRRIIIVTLRDNESIYRKKQQSYLGQAASVFWPDITKQGDRTLVACPRATDYANYDWGISPCDLLRKDPLGRPGVNV